MKSIYLICYDISNDKNRTKVSEKLEEYGGVRINLSVFECLLTKNQLEKLIIYIEDKTDKKYDSVKYYYICKSCYLKSDEIGKKDNNGSETRFI